MFTNFINTSKSSSVEIFLNKIFLNKLSIASLNKLISESQATIIQFSIDIEKEDDPEKALQYSDDMKEQEIILEQLQKELENRIDSFSSVRH